jgi:hypothetical protein
MDKIQKGRSIELMDMKEGWVLVFDLDQTITYDDDRTESIHFNPKIIEILKGAVKDRQQGIVSAIFLLTNNADKEYIEYIHNELKEIIGLPMIFDSIMDANHPSRIHVAHLTQISNAKQKSLADVECMLRQTCKTTKNLIYRVLFFDDQEHLLSLQLKKAGKPEHFIHVHPPFLGNESVISVKKLRKQKKTRKVKRTN